METLKFVILLSSIFFCINGDEQAAADYDDTKQGQFSHLCNPNMLASNHSKIDDQNFCECNFIASVVIGKPVLKIDCMLSDGVTNLTNEIFKAEKLPINTMTLILSFQMFTSVPFFDGDLKELEISNNLITVIRSANFEGINVLERLDLSYNRISVVEEKAFSSLKLLHYLDLTSNHLVVVPANTFAPLMTLKTLKVSSNEGFGRKMGRDAVNSSLLNLYLQLGVTILLESLEMERCNLTKINLMRGVGLRHLSLRFNDVVDFAMLELPGFIQHLKLSGNPVREINANSLVHVYNVTDMILEDMPFLGRVEENSLHFPYLQHLSLEGSKNLSFFHPFSTNHQLKVLNLRGCNLRTLNVSMKEMFEGLDELYLEGNPFTCDCDLQWLKDVDLEINLKCNKPDEFYGKLLTEIDEEMKCSKISVFMKKLVNSLILLALLIGCSIAIWCFFRQLSPRSRRKNFQKVGPESPYQRVTIEPNRAEYSLH